MCKIRIALFAARDRVGHVGDVFYGTTTMPILPVSFMDRKSGGLGGFVFSS